MNLELLFYFVSIALSGLILLVVYLSVSKLKSSLGEVPKLWKYMLIGFVFVTSSEFFSLFIPIYQQSCYHIDYYTELFQLVGLTFFLLGFLPYLRELKGE